MSQNVNPYERPLVRWTMHITWAVILVAAPCISFFGLVDLLKARETLRWPTTTAIVTESAIVSGLSGTNLTYKATVKYHYVVDGQHRIGTGIKVGSTNSSHKFYIKNIIDAFPAGTRTQASYNPNDPSESYLRPGADWGDYVVVISPFLFFFFGVFYFRAIFKRDG